MGKLGRPGSVKRSSCCLYKDDGDISEHLPSMSSADDIVCLICQDLRLQLRKTVSSAETLSVLLGET